MHFFVYGALETGDNTPHTEDPQPPVLTLITRHSSQDTHTAHRDIQESGRDQTTQIHAQITVHTVWSARCVHGFAFSRILLATNSYSISSMQPSMWTLGYPDGIRVTAVLGP